MTGAAVAVAGGVIAAAIGEETGAVGAAIGAAAAAATNGPATAAIATEQIRRERRNRFQGRRDFRRPFSCSQP
jgi:hypothetical protein